MAFSVKKLWWAQLGSSDLVGSGSGMVKLELWVAVNQGSVLSHLAEILLEVIESGRVRRNGNLWQEMQFLIKLHSNKFARLQKLSNLFVYIPQDGINVI